MAAHPLPLSQFPKLQIETKKPVGNVRPSFRGLHLVTTHETETQTADSLEQARRIVSQVEWEIQQQAARERAYRQNRWRAPITAHANNTRNTNEDGLFARLRNAVGF